MSDTQGRATAAATSFDPLQAALSAAGRWSRLTHLAVGFGSVGILAALDMVSGPYISLAVFYLLPLATVGWYTSRPWSVALATIAGFAWFMDFRPLLTPGLPVPVIVWACCSRVGMCLATAWLIGALREMYDQQKKLAGTDEVTGIANRRTLLEIAQRELARSRRSGKPISVIYLDADRFKAVNDLSGHAEGDRLLREVAATLNDHCRQTDACATRRRRVCGAAAGGGRRCGQERCRQAAAAAAAGDGEEPLAGDVLDRRGDVQEAADGCGAVAARGG
ncbi:MAG: GGDEF domain-containing protein [Phycisphaerales bacterium]